MAVTNFQLNDKVKAFGLTGTVTSDSEQGAKKIKVIFDQGGQTELFTLQGKLETFHADASLTLVSRDPVPVQNALTLYINIYPNQKRLYETKEAADASAGKNIIAQAVKVTGTYVTYEEA